MIGQKHIGQVRRAKIKTRANKRFEEYESIKATVRNLERNGDCIIDTNIVSVSTIKRLRASLPEHGVWLHSRYMEISII